MEEDSSGEEFYSAPESDGEESVVKSEADKELSPGQNNASPSYSTSHNKNTHTAEEQTGPKDNTREPEDACPTATCDKDSLGQEYVSGLDNRLVSDDQEVVEGDKVELSEEQIKVSE